MQRRKFLKKGVMAVAATGLTSYSFGYPTPQGMTVQAVIDIIMKDLGGTIASGSVDTIKIGKPDTVVSGIVTTMFATMDVIAQAKKIGANFIIAHEPTYYNHTDGLDWVVNNSVLDAKRKELEKDGIVVWRFHDYCHQIKPEPMSFGIAKRAGWASFYQVGKRTLDIPTMNLLDLGNHLKKSLGITMLRVIGDDKQLCRRVALIPGAAGGQTHLKTVEEFNPDVLVVGEVHEWETAEYIRDLRAQGKKTALIILGHSVSEEPGMEVVTDWLQPKIPNIKVTHIASGDPFNWR